MGARIVKLPKYHRQVQRYLAVCDDGLECTVPLSLKPWGVPALENGRAPKAVGLERRLMRDAKGDAARHDARYHASPEGKVL